MSLETKLDKVMSTSIGDIPKDCTPHQVSVERRINEMRQENEVHYSLLGNTKTSETPQDGIHGNSATDGMGGTNEWCMP